MNKWEMREEIEERRRKRDAIFHEGEETFNKVIFYVLSVLTFVYAFAIYCV